MAVPAQGLRGSPRGTVAEAGDSGTKVQPIRAENSSVTAEGPARGWQEVERLAGPFFCTTARTWHQSPGFHVIALNGLHRVLGSWGERRRGWVAGGSGGLHGAEWAACGGRRCEAGWWVPPLCRQTGFPGLLLTHPVSPLGHNVAAPPPTSPLLSRQEGGEGPGGRRPCQRRQRLFDGAFQETRPSPLLASHWSDRVMWPPPPRAAGRLGRGCAVTPSTGGGSGQGTSWLLTYW